MNLNKRIIGIVFLIIISLNACSQSRKDLWEKDINYLRTELAQKHKNLFFQTNREFYHQKLDSIIEIIDQLQDIEIYIALQEVIAEMGDDHTSIYDRKLPDYGRFPIWLEWFSDGIYILNTTPEYKNLMFKKVVALNNKPIENIVSKVLSLSAKTNDAVVKSHFLSYFSYKAILDYYDIIDSDSIQVSYVNDVGDIDKVYVNSIKPSKNEGINWMGFGITNKAFCEQNRDKLFWHQYDNDNNILYAQYNKCLSREVIKRYGAKNKAKDYPSFKKFSDELIDILESKPIEKFIFDMRYNGGGSSDIGTELIKRIAEIESINKKGKLFVVVGRKTFSSAILNSLDFQNYTEAIFVGEPTGGRPNHYGEVRKFTLPNSGLIVNFSTKYFTYAKEDADSFYPNYVIETTFDEYINGIDPVYEWIVNYDITK